MAKVCYTKTNSQLNLQEVIMADSNTKYTFVLEAKRADGKSVKRFTNKPDNRAQVLINNGYTPKDEHSKVEFIALSEPMTKSEYIESVKATAVAGA